MINGGISLVRTRRAIEEMRKAEEGAVVDAARHELDADEEEAIATRNADERRARRDAEAAAPQDQAGSGRNPADK